MPAAASRRLLRPRFDFGLFSRARAWPRLFSGQQLGADLRQGLWLSASTLPLSLLLASFAGAPASSGLISAAVGSAVCVLLGGTRSALSGPGITTTLLSSHIIARHGLEGLGTVLYLAGALQMLTGALGVGRVVRLVPLSVLRASVFGTGLVILIRQLPHTIGAAVEPGGGMLMHLDGLGSHLPRLDPTVLAVAIGAGLLGLLGLLNPRIPGALIALVVATLVAGAFGLSLPSLDEAATLPMPRIPLPPSSGFAHLFGSVFELWGAMTLCTAIDTAALERLAADRGQLERTDPNQELIANGLATVALAFLHGLPASQLVARSSLAVRLGIDTPRPALVQALLLLVAFALAFPLLHLVPMAALTGVALSVAVPLLRAGPLRALGRVSRLELFLSIVTIATMLFSGIVTGLLVGLGLAFAVAARRMARTRALVFPSKDELAPHQVNFSGPITFLAALELEQLHGELAALPTAHGLLLDLRSVAALDGNGALSLVATLDAWRARDGKLALLGPSQLVQQKLARADETPRQLPAHVSVGSLKHSIALNDQQLDAILGRPVVRQARPQLLAGLARFREEKREQYDSLFAQLADGQHPHTMFITCSDSRIDPALLMGSYPGDLFIVRAIGALVARSGSAVMPQEGAAVEYGVGVLGVRTIVVCGHSKCGAINALKKGQVPDELTTLKAWAGPAAEVAGELASFATADEAARAVTVRQVENLLSYPLVRQKHERGELQLHAWFYDLGQVELFEWDAASGGFVVLGSETRPRSVPPISM